MMRKLFFALALISTLTAAPVLAAPSPETLTPNQMDSIKQNCGQVQVGLRDLQKRDTILRINRGRLYDMTLRQTGAFVSRLQANNIDAAAIKDADHAIRNGFQRFTMDYDHYADSLDQAISSKCQSDPGGFYQALQQAIDQRGLVVQDVNTIKDELAKYVKELKALQELQFPAQEGK